MGAVLLGAYAGGQEPHGGPRRVHQAAAGAGRRALHRCSA